MDAGGKQYYPHLRPSIKRQALDCMSDWLHRSTGSTEAALQLRRAAASLGRGVVAHVVRYSLTNETRSYVEAATCPVDLKLFA